MVEIQTYLINEISETFFHTRFNEEGRLKAVKIPLAFKFIFCFICYCPM